MYKKMEREGLFSVNEVDHSIISSTPNYFIRLVSDLSETKDLLYNFHEFLSPHLSKRGYDIDSYSVKLNLYAVVLQAITPDNKPLGFIAYYINDTKKSLAYLTLIVVDSQCHKMGVGSALLKRFIDHASSLGFSYLKLEVNKRNTAAMNLFEKYGFSLDSEASDNHWYMAKII